MKKQLYKLDLHTHSILSHDGGLRASDYDDVFSQGMLDVVAITDHNRIDFALDLQKKLGDKIIVGEEIMTNEGEMIGLYLKHVIAPFMDAKSTARAIHAQGGLVVIPHPFETLRKGIPEVMIRSIAHDIQIMEVYNGRSFQRQTQKQATMICQEFHFAPVASSDCHCKLGIGKTYTEIAEIPTATTLVNHLHQGILHAKSAPWLSYFCPKLNKLKKTLHIE